MKDPKIILISLPAPFADEPAMNPQLGLCYIASYLRQSGFANIVAVDFTLNKEFDFFQGDQYLKTIPTDGDYYGIYCMTVQFQWLVTTAQYIRRNNRKAVIVAGGPHATTEPEDCLRRAGVDMAVVGEGEEAFAAIVSGQDPSQIAGASFLDPAGHMIQNGRASIKFLDALPFPDRDIFDIQKYKRTIKGEKAVHIVTLRGCPYSCAFCDKTTVGTSVRYRSVQNVIAEMDLVIERYGWRSFVIYDDIFTLNRKRVDEFCAAFKARRIQWRCWSRTNTIDEEMLTIMKEAGLVSITFGVESGDDGVLKRINKSVTVAQHRRALLACKKVGVPVRCSLMYGNPGETRKSVQNTIDLIAETQPDEWNLAVLAPIPGSDIWNRPQEYGIIFDRDWVIQNNYAMTNRFDSSGIGSVWISHAGVSASEFEENLRYLVSELNRVCPRKKIQDTIQDIRMDNLAVKRP